ncbi:MAG: ABC transporter ATP-binding protein [Bryobacteraceae bacterium]|nr:ABC transporter ATP-binding protein [Bryobacteraceae bacterium]
MTAIRFEHVFKSYPRYQSIAGGLKSAVLRLPDAVRALRRDQIVALDDVSFEIARGEKVGLIGPNGSGKSTTLALIAGVLKPDAGRVEVRGRVCSLLELGAGFHPELTGLENIVLNGILLGLTRREVLAKMREIVAFSGLEAFLEQPLRTYSSGMLARLGFSVAAHLEPEILLIDEILAVGDLHFQAKCQKKIDEFRASGVTIVLVSHSPDQVLQVCNRVIWLQGGCVRADGDPDAVVGRYVSVSTVPGVDA